MLEDRRELRHLPRPERRPVALTGGRHEQRVALTAENATQHGQPPPARTCVADFGVVADLVTQQRRRIVVERCQHHASDLPRPAWLAPLVDDLDHDRFRLDVIVLGGGALQRNEPDLLRAVDIDHTYVPRQAARLTRLRRDHFAERRHVLDVRQRDAVRAAMLGEEPEVRWIRHEVIRILPSEPLRLLRDAGADGQHHALTGRKREGAGVAPAPLPPSVGILVDPSLHPPNGGELRGEVVRMPEKMS